jgi:hypothetical protein
MTSKLVLVVSYDSGTKIAPFLNAEHLLVTAHLVY